MSTITVRVEHLRAARLCSRGARMWFAQHGLDYMHFIREGYPIEVIEATNDALGLHVAAIAREEAEGED